MAGTGAEGGNVKMEAVFGHRAGGMISIVIR